MSDALMTKLERNSLNFGNVSHSSFDLTVMCGLASDTG